MGNTHTKKKTVTSSQAKEQPKFRVRRTTPQHVGPSIAWSDGFACLFLSGSSEIL